MRIALWYFGLSVSWIFASGWLLHHFVQDPVWEARLETIKGWGFVTVTAVLLGWSLNRYFRAIRKAAIRLHASEAHMRLIGDNLPNGYVFQYTMGPDGKPRFTYISAGAERIHGVGAAEVIRDATRLMGQIDPAELPVRAAAEAESMRNLSDVEMDLRMSRPDGVQKVVHLHARPHRGADGLTSWDGFASDITDRLRTEAEMRESEKQFATIFKHSPAAIGISRMSDGKFVDVNEAFERLYGYSRDEILGRTSPELQLWVSPNRPQIMAELQEKKHVVADMQGRRKSGELCEVLITLVLVDLRGESCMMGTLIDVTERRQAVNSMRRSAEEFRAIFDTASIGMGQADPSTGRYIRVNQKFCEITGYAAEELLQMRVTDITHPADQAADVEIFRKVLRGQIPGIRREKRYLRKDGTVVWAIVHMNVICDSAGKPVLTAATIEDITERRKTEEERMRLNTAFEQAAESIVIADLGGTIIYVNPAFERITGYSRLEAIGQNPRFLKSGRQDAAFYRQMWDTLTRGDVWHGHIINQRKDGRLYEEDGTISPVRDASGKVVNYIAIKLDVTREVELENQVRQSQKMEANGQLAGGVAHDFNNILSSILMQVELGADDPGSSRDNIEMFRQIRADAERAASLTRQLLLFSRRQVMQTRELDLNELVTHLTKMLQRIIGEDIRLVLSLNPAPVMTCADAGMLDQVLMNLAVNARDAMPSGGRLQIETSERVVDEDAASLYPDASPGRYVCVSLSDSGCGIPPEVLPRIFEPFFTTKDAGKGTGLGLATVFGIIKQHRGWVTVDTEVKKGTTFRVFIPAAKTAPAPAAGNEKPLIRGGSETILLVEDDMAVRLATKTILARRGYIVLEAGNGSEAIKIWREQRDAVALLFTDLVMPGGVNGRQLAQRLQTDRPGLKVIFASGYSPEFAGREIQLSPDENFVQKPFRPDHLLKTVRACLDGTHGPDDGASGASPFTNDGVRH